MLDRYLSNLSVDIAPFALCMLDSGWRLTLPGPPVAMLHFIVQGEGWVIGPDGDRKPVGPNWLIVVPNGLVHSLETASTVSEELIIPCTPDGPPVHRIVAGDGGPVEMVFGCGTLRVQYGETVGLFDHLQDLLIVALSSLPEVPQLFQSILTEQSQMQLGTPVLQGAIMTQLMVHMLRKLAVDTDSCLPWLNALDDDRLGRAIDQMITKPAQQHTVESLAEAANMSRSAFARHFNETFKRSPISMLNHVRMEQAARLLKTGRIPVDQIATRVGFSSRSHFSRVFKKHTGSSPADFRRA
jgi:AraC family transcriptional activator of mtrCDE